MSGVMREPGTEHPMSIEPHGGQVRVRFNGQVVAESRRALILRESGLPPVLYLPREDANPGYLRASTHSSYCPYKGDASYLTVEVGGRRSENAVWSYEAPYPAAAAIAGFIAFYASRVDAIEAEPPLA